MGLVLVREGPGPHHFFFTNSALFLSRSFSIRVGPSSALNGLRASNNAQNGRRSTAQWGWCR